MTDQRKTERRSATVDREIDDNLKRAFDAIAEEPIPDRLTNLLDQLRKTGGSSTQEGGGKDG